MGTPRRLQLVYYSFVVALFRTSAYGVLRTYGPVAEKCHQSGDYRKVMSHIMHDYLFRCPNLRAAQLLQVSLFFSSHVTDRIISDIRSGYLASQIRWCDIRDRVTNRVV